MKYRLLGRTKLEVSVVGLGTWQFGGEWGERFSAAEVERILRRGRELGINLLDTAECYGDHLSESLIGEAIQGTRDEWIVATKFGHHFNAPFDRTDRWSVNAVQQQLEDSLRALDTDYIDLYQFHSGDNQAFDQPKLWEMLNRQVDAGKIRFLGISLGNNDNLYQTEQATEVGADVIQVVYNRLDRTAEERVFPSCRAQNLGVLTRVPLASGLLSGKYRPGHQFTDPEDVRSQRDPREIQEQLQRVQAIRREQVPQHIEMASWALAWCLQHPAVTCVIPGCKSVEQVESNARAASLALVREDHPQ
ncbi:MAG: aldo/keto reductase, partial [Chloroflexota bacterium]|nr:aldo/keto reductase [Chloroflexota bacterium]